MNELKLYCDCGNELPKVGAVKNYCSAKCYQKAYRESKKKQAKEFSVAVEEFVSENNSVSELERLRAENEELKYKLQSEINLDEIMPMHQSKTRDKASEIWDALRLLYNQKQNITQLLAQAEENLHRKEERKSDLEHKMHIPKLTKGQFYKIAEEHKDICAERSSYKSLLTAYQLVDRLEFNPEFSKGINYGKAYKLKTEEGSFTYGEDYSEFLEKQKLLVEAKVKVDEEKVKENESLKEIKAYIEELHESPITGRMGTTISFAKNSLSDLKTKVQQLSTKSKAVRVDLGRSTITTYN